MLLLTAGVTAYYKSYPSTNRSGKQKGNTPPVAWLVLLPVLAFAMPSVTATASEPADVATGQPTPGSPPGQGAVETDATSEKYRRAGEIIRQMLRPEVVAAMERKEPLPVFGGELPRLAYEHSMVDLWTRPSLGLKERSLVTIGMLIALGAESELRTHFEAGLRNGLTVEQLAEIIYHATAYVGFPAASTALSIASDVVANYEP